MTGEKQRAVAIINLLLGVVIGAILVVVAAVGREGSFGAALGMFSICLLLVGYRIHRVFQVIE
jgi:hypothetical protein